MDLPQALAALVAGFVLACATVPVGISGAVLLLPVHLWVLDVPAARVAATNLLFNVVSVPGALLRTRRRTLTASATSPAAPDLTTPRDRTAIRTTALVLLAGATGSCAGTLVRWQADSAFLLPRSVMGLALVLVGVVLLVPLTAGGTSRQSLPGLGLCLPLAALTGMAGGLSGIGGGSLMAPALVALGTAVRVAAPLALTCTWVTSLSALGLGLLLPGVESATTLPVWSVGVAAGLGGLLGGAFAVRRLSGLPEAPVRRLLALVAVVLGATQLMALL